MSEMTATDLPLQAIRDYCETQPIQRLSLFGSALRDDLREDSDIDLLVEYRQGAIITLLTLTGHEIALGEIFGWKVDLRMPGELGKSFRQQVIDGARLLYEEKP